MSRECPISRLDYKSATLLSYIDMAESLRTSMMSYGMGGGTGTITLFGPDLSQWPSYYVDAMLIYMQEYSEVNSTLAAIDKAEERQRAQ